MPFRGDAGVIAVTGATGELGRRVVAALSGYDVAVRLVVRDPARAPDSPGAEVAVASYESRPTLTAALRGARTVFMVSGHEDPDRVSLHLSAVQACVDAGVDRVVYTSFMGAAPLASFAYARDHASTELAIRDAGLRLTSLRSSLYADIAPLMVGDDGTLRGPAGNGRIAWVARTDVARLAAAVLVDDAHAGAVYDVSGAQAIDLDETASLLADVTGRDIRYHAESMEEARASRAGAEDWQIEGWVGSYAGIATGEIGVTSHTVEHVTGQRPWSFAEFLVAEPASWAHLRLP